MHSEGKQIETSPTVWSREWFVSLRGTTLEDGRHGSILNPSCWLATVAGFSKAKRRKERRKKGRKEGREGRERKKRKGRRDRARKGKREAGKEGFAISFS